VRLVGNVMIDALMWIMEKPMGQPLPDDQYAVATIHRPVNVDTREGIGEIVTILGEVARELPVLFFAHPRTVKNIAAFDIGTNFIRVDSPPVSGMKNAVYITKPRGYRQFIGYVSRAAVVVTDSGGLQAETTYLGIPCITLRNQTEMPATVKIGTNTLVGRDKAKVINEIGRITRGSYRKGTIPELWDGGAGKRIVDLLLEYISPGRGG